MHSLEKGGFEFGAAKVFYDLRDNGGVVEDDIVSGLCRSHLVLSWLSPEFFRSDWAMRETWSMLKSRLRRLSGFLGETGND